MNFSKKEIENLVREELSIEIRRRSLIKSLNEVNSRLSEYDSNLPTGIPDPGESKPDPIINNYIINSNGGIDVEFSNYNPIRIDMDSFVSFYENYIDREFPDGMSTEESFKAIMIENDHNINEFIEKYVINKLDWNDLENLDKDEDYDEDLSKGSY